MVTATTMPTTTMSAGEPTQGTTSNPLASANKMSSSNNNMVGPYRLHKTLGEGASSKVKLGVNINTGQHVAVKIMMPKDTSSRSDIDREITILKRLKHPHIVQLLDVLYDQPPGCVSCCLLFFIYYYYYFFLFFFFYPFFSSSFFSHLVPPFASLLS
jgi:serine/threonine protein kinase